VDGSDGRVVWACGRVGVWALEGCRVEQAQSGGGRGWGRRRQCRMQRTRRRGGTLSGMGSGAEEREWSWERVLGQTEVGDRARWLEERGAGVAR
jgi:hypothetical protein